LLETGHFYLGLTFAPAPRRGSESRSAAHEQS